jgi:MFS family permease
MQDQTARHRYGVVALLILLFTITYLDRICISVAGPRMQESLHIDPIGWGWVGMFTLSYCLFEIPTGALGDRIGPRRVLTRVVLWWSSIIALTAVPIREPDWEPASRQRYPFSFDPEAPARSAEGRI